METCRHEVTSIHTEGISHKLTSACIILTRCQRVHPVGPEAQKGLSFVVLSFS